jgi:quinol monooxygenase YgiN
MNYPLAHLRCRPGEHPILLRAARAMTEAARLEPGCIPYVLNISATGPQSMLFVETWRSRESLSEHFGMPRLAAWRSASERYFTERRIEFIHSEKVETP